MASSTLTVVCWVFTLFATLFGLVAFGRGIAHIWREVAAGTPDPGRAGPVGKRLWMTLTTILSHREFRHRPWVRAAHWLVMMSFPLLFFTLITSYGQLRDQRWTLPVLGHFLPWEWITEVFAWGGLLGICCLMIVRARAGHGSADEAAVSADSGSDSGAKKGADEGDTARASAASRPAKRHGSAEAPASRFLGSTRWQALFVELVVLVVCACIVILHGLEYALLSVTPSSESAPLIWHFPLTGWIGGLLADVSSSALANAIVLVSTLKILTSMLWMMVVGVQTSMGVAWHRFVAIVNLYTRRNADGTKSLGPADHMLLGGVPVTSPDVFDDLPEDTVLGVGSTEDLSWKARLDLYACTECGRCQELCPAWNTSKPLSPKLLVLAMRDHMNSASNTQIVADKITDAQLSGGHGVSELTGGEGDEGATILMDNDVEPSPHSFDVLTALSTSGATGPQGVSVVAGPLVPGVVTEEVLWDCTMCGACVEQCPVDIEHIDHVLDLRRHQVLMEAAFPRELGRAFRGMESKQNPYNQPARKRLEWAKHLDFDVPVIGEDVEDASEVDYLFWVGCAGAFDDKAKTTSAAVAELLHTAGVSFAVLGSGESCTGDPARRAGNEVLFQMLAAQAIETLHEAKAQKIVVSCAHCFNTIAGEYPELGGHFDVIHHTQLLNRLVREGLLKPVAPSSAVGGEGGADGGTGAPTGCPLTVTYHDACFLGRHNRVYEPPRELVGSLPGVALVEMPRNRDRAMCCGAGGSHAWFEESRGTRIADARIVEAASTGADVVATACPFCSQMLGSASGSSAGFISAPDHEGEAGTAPRAGTDLPAVKDVAVMLLEAVRRGRS